MEEEVKKEDIKKDDLLYRLYKAKSLVAVLSHYDFMGEMAKKDIDRLALTDLALEELEDLIILLDT